MGSRHSGEPEKKKNGGFQEGNSQGRGMGERRELIVREIHDYRGLAEG